MELLPWEELVLPVEEEAQIQGHWVVVLGQDVALVLLVLQGMLQVVLDTVHVLLVLQDMLPVLRGRSLEDQHMLGTRQEQVAGSPRRASLEVGVQRGCCWWAKRRITGERGEKRRVRWGTLILSSG